MGHNPLSLHITCDHGAAESLVYFAPNNCVADAGQALLRKSISGISTFIAVFDDQYYTQLSNFFTDMLFKMVIQKLPILHSVTTHTIVACLKLIHTITIVLYLTPD